MGLKKKKNCKIAPLGPGMYEIKLDRICTKKKGHLQVFGNLVKKGTVTDKELLNKALAKMDSVVSQISAMAVIVHKHDEQMHYLLNSLERDLDAARDHICDVRNGTKPLPF